MMNASGIQELLRAKHAKDVYVSECKNGPSWGGCLRLDGWAMKKSWASPLITGYEIKISRSDFVRDQKYLEYAKYCNALYLVAPKNIIQIEELPEGVGYYQVASTGTRLICKRKAVRRDDPIPEELYRYILMARARILSPRETWRGDPETNQIFFQNWLETREINRRLGVRVSKKLKEVINQKIFDVQKKNDSLQSENEKLSEVKRIIKELGINIYAWNLEDRFKEAFDERINGEKNKLKSSISTAVQSLEYISAQIDLAEGN